MKLANIKLRNRLALAPMAGVADLPFRELCIRHGAGYVIGEMVSSKGLTMQDRKSKQLLTLSDTERPAAVQIFGNSPETMAQAAKECLAFKPDLIDINMGCPAPKIVNNRGGSALMKDPALAQKIIEAVVKAVPVPVTVKFRTGWDAEHLNAVEFAKRAEAAGAAAVTVHGRTREQMYAFPIDYGTIADVKQAVSIPVIGNGGIASPADAAKMLEQTGCDMIMIGQGALGSPWVFQQILAYLEHGSVLPDPPLSQKLLIMIEHVESIIAYKGEHIGIREARKHVAWYLKGMRGAAEYRRIAGTILCLDDVKALAARVLTEQGQLSDEAR